MMIFMLANTVSCIVTSVVLNVVDHRQVSEPARHLIYLLLIWLLTLLSWLLHLQGGILNKTTKRSQLEQTDSDREPLNPGDNEQSEDDEGDTVRSRSVS